MAFNDFIRKIKFGFLQVVFDSRNDRQLAVDQIKRILFLRHDNKVGDTVVSSFLFRELRKLGPQLQIGVVASASNQKLIELMPAVDRVLLTKKGILASVGTAFQIRRWRPDLVVDFSYDLKPKALFLLATAGAPFVCSYSPKQLKVRNVKPVINPLVDHMADQLTALLSILGIREINQRSEVRLDQASLEIADQWRAQNVDREYFGVNLKAAAKARSFDFAAANSILKLLLTHWPHAEIVLFGEASEKKIHGELQKQNPPVRSAAGLPLTVQMGILSLAKGIVTPDTAWVHIASAFDIPTVAVFRPEEESTVEKTSRIWAPRATKSRIVFSRRLPGELEPEASDFDLSIMEKTMLEVFQ